MHRIPKQWWPCRLDAERLAWESAVAAQDAANRVCASRGQFGIVSTSPALVAASFAALGHLRVRGRATEPWAPLSGFFPTADGWLRTHANYPHHARALSRATGAEDRDALIAALDDLSALEAEEKIIAAGGCAAAVRTAEQWTEHPHHQASIEERWTSAQVSGERRPLSSGGRRPLEGIRVLDITRVAAGPMCTQLLGCLGADVLRIDAPESPELLDHYLASGMGKRSVALDLADGRQTLERLLSGADVIVLGRRPGALDRFGLDPLELQERFRHLVVASLSAWGETGPWAQRRGFDSIVQAATGIAVACRDEADEEGPAPGDRPGALPVQALDHATGLRLAARVMEMLADGRSGIIRANLLGAARTLLSFPPRAPQAIADLPVRTVKVRSGHVPLDLVPPALTVDGRVLSAPIGEYGTASPHWL